MTYGYLPPHCQEVEDNDNVWRYQDSYSVAIWKAAIDGLRMWLQNQKMAPGIVQVIYSRMLTWHHSIQPEP
jgi:hypothetical protein